MKAYISHKGFLTVIPESETESYALQCWFDRYTKQASELIPGLAIQDYKTGTVTEVKGEGGQS